MRVLEVMASGARGGGADHLARLMAELRALGVECAAAVGDDGPLRERLAEAGFPVHPLGLMHSRTDPLGALWVAELVRRVSPDIVHWHGTRAGFYGALARPLLLPRPPRTVYTVHGLAYRQEVARARKAALLAAECLCARAADRVISVSSSDLEDLTRRRFVAPASATHIPNAADTERFHPGDKGAARARLGLAEDDFVAGMVSRLVPQKSVDDAIAAVAMRPSVVLVIAGDGPERSALEAQAAPLGARVRFLGARDDVPEILRALDVFVLSSRWEGEPIALLEALASGLPCIATATEGAREVLEPLRAGLLVPVGSPVALAAALQEIEMAPFHRVQWGNAAREAALARNWPDVAARTLAVYRDALERP